MRSIVEKTLQVRSGLTLAIKSRRRSNWARMQRVRRYRERRREGLRLLKVELPEAVTGEAIARGMLKPSANRLSRYITAASSSELATAYSETVR